MRGKKQWYTPLERIISREEGPRGSAKQRIESWLRRMEPYVSTPQPGSRLSEEESRRILLMYQCGKKVREIAQWTQRPEEEIWRVIREANVRQGIRLLGNIWR